MYCPDLNPVSYDIRKPVCFNRFILYLFALWLVVVIIFAIGIKSLLFGVALAPPVSLLLYYIWLRVMYPWLAREATFCISRRPCTKGNIILQGVFWIVIGLGVSSFPLANALSSTDPNAYLVFTYNLLGTFLVLIAWIWILDLCHWLFVFSTFSFYKISTRQQQNPSPPQPPWRNKIWMNVKYWLPLLLWIPSSVWSLVNSYQGPTVIRFSVPIQNLPSCMDGFRIAMASDVHVGALVGRDILADHVSMMNSLGGDIIVMVGDYGDAKVSALGIAMEQISAISAPHGVFFVTGNHEWLSGDAELWLDFMRKRNITTLDNARVEVGRTSDCTMDLAGLQDRSGTPNITAALQGRNTSRPLVMLIHQPTTFQAQQATEAGAGLMLSGHTHGGQTWPMHAITRFAFYYFSGLYRRGNTFIYVSEGAVGWGPRVRFFSEPDIAVIELKTTDYQIPDSEVGMRYSHRMGDFALFLLVVTVIFGGLLQISQFLLYRNRGKEISENKEGNELLTNNTRDGSRWPRLRAARTCLERCFMYPAVTAEEWDRAYAPPSPPSETHPD